MKSLNIEQIEFLQLTNADNSTRSIAEKAIALGKRIDGRRLTQMRNIKVEELGTSGNVFVSLGNTVVFAAIAAEIVDPNLEHPTEGILLFNLELSPMCSTSYEPGKQMEQEQELSYALEKIYKEAGVIDVESLCIVAAKHVSPDIDAFECILI
ncbi:exosome complex component RRP45 [Babesia ovis]|uniref:Exosome complex component RRP45 n=1 Tax=Babesia ovis TaxID=5869 RepID=A0A9W5TCG4_BABOV|nr:exosome complex component RRP45 [Babesia ovis]